jgi:hypothetical protein
LRDDHGYGWSGCLDKLSKFLGQPCQRPMTLGSFCWNELLTSDPPGAARFYAQVFGWQAADFPTPGLQYTLFRPVRTESKPS